MSDLSIDSVGHGRWKSGIVSFGTSETSKSLEIRMENEYKVIQSDLFGMVKWPFQRLSDLQLGDKKVTLNHLVYEL